MDLKVIQGKQLTDNDLLVEKEAMILSNLLKRIILGDVSKRHIVDISCFYQKDIDDLLKLTNIIKKGEVQ